MKNMAKILCFVFSLVFVLSTFGIGTFAQEVTGLSGEGTVESPYLINNVQDLLWFRDDVNAGNGYEGKYVKLNADLYLSNIDWSVNIGDDFNTSFDGHFDGGNHTIHNLKSTENAQKSDGFICTGLFGAIYGEATIKNLTINNAKISVGEYTGNNIGVVVGFAYMATGSIENVTISGDVKIDAPNGCNVGTILGYDYYGDLDINNCKVLANEGSYINTSNCSQVGGIIGYAATNCEITDCTVENLAIDAAGLAGGVVGVANGDTNQFVTVTNATVKNVDITVTKDMWYNSGAVVVGALGGKTAVINGTTFENVTVNGKSAYNLAGSGYVVKPGVPVTGVAATLNGVYYTSLQDAINAAADGDVIVINNNVILSSQDAQPLLKPVYNRESYCGIYIPDDKQITIDLAGYTISYVDEHYEVDNVMILNLGSLTINDSVGGGLITYKPVAGSSTYSKFYSTIFNCGTLIVNGGTIENTADAETDVTNAIDNHSRLSHEYGNDCILVVNDGTIIGAYYYAIRQYTHYSEGVLNRVTINGGTIAGGIYMQHGDSWYYANPAAKRLNVDCGLTINGGEFIGTYTDNFNVIKSRLSNPDNKAWTIEINGGNFNDAIINLQVQRGVYYANGVSGTTVPAEATGARNEEWLAANGGFINGGAFNNDVTEFLVSGFMLIPNESGSFGVTSISDAPYIGENGNWWIGDVDTGMMAYPNVEPMYCEEHGVMCWFVTSGNGTVECVGQAIGLPGTVPTIAIVDGYWYIDNKDGKGLLPTGVKAIGTDGLTITSIYKDATKGDELVSVYVVTFSNGYTWSFTVTNGIDGIQGLDGAQGPQGAKGPTGDRGLEGANGNDNNQTVIIVIAIATVCLVFTLAVVLYRGVDRRSWWCTR